MTKYDITMYCKDKKTLKQIFQFLALQYKTKLKKLQTPLYFSQRKTKIKKITVLKSPHVNKTAQKHFEYRVYSTKLQLQSYRPRKYLFVLKKFQNHLFPELKMTIKQKTNPKTTQSLKNNLFLPNNYRIGFVNDKSSCNQKVKYKKNVSTRRNYLASLDKKMVFYTKIFDHYGG